MKAEVVIAGGGPAGLMLACELRMRGVYTVVLERSRTRDERLRGENIMKLTGQALDRHALLEALDDSTEAVPPRPLPSVMSARQQRVEQVLEAHATQEGADLRRGCEVVDLWQDNDGVNVEVREDSGRTHSIRTRFLVGCDGPRSTVRKRAGFATTGTAPTMTLYQGLVTVVEPTPPPPRPRGHHRAPDGIALWAPGPCRLVVMEFTAPPPEPAPPVTVEEVQASLRRVTGIELTLTEPKSLGRFTDTTRLATTYRRHRVLLAGDAAHLHPPTGGGQGLNIAVTDAVNLGWKLSAAVQGWAPTSLLDTYTAERRPVGERAIRNARAEMLLLMPNEAMAPAYEMYTEIWQDRRIRPHLIDFVSMVHVAYDMGVPRRPAHDLLGRSAADAAITTTDGTVRLAALLRTGRGVLIDMSEQQYAGAAAASWRDRIDVVSGSCAQHDDLAALLVRPDGWVAWVCPTGGPAQPEPLQASLQRWFGPPSD